MISYADGAYAPTESLSLPFAGDIVGTVRGYRIFTACRTVRGAVFHCADHIERLFQNARAIAMEIPHTREELKNIIERTVAKNKETASGEFLLEVVLSGGAAAANGIAPKGPAKLYIAVFPFKAPPAEWYANGVSLATFPFERQFADVKLMNYVGGVIAHQTVVKQYGAHEALFVAAGEKRWALEGTTFNFFVVRGGAVITHPLNGAILSGITRKVALALAKKAGIEMREERFAYEELLTADEAFMTSSTRNVVPVVKIDGRQIGDGSPGIVTMRLTRLFEEYMNSYH